jgi:hypothetical protein
MEYNTLATTDIITKTSEALKEHGIEPIVVATGKDALEKIKELIPEGVSVMNGTSATLEQIGYIDYLKSGEHPWKNLHADILAETDPEKQKMLRKYSVVSDYYLGSVHALVQTGELIIASNSGSQLPHITYTSPNIIFVVSTKKIVATLEEGMKRLKEHVFPLEDKRITALYGRGTMLSKILILNRENPTMGRNLKLIMVEEDLGF